MDIRICTGWGERHPPRAELNIPEFMLPGYIDREQQYRDALECAAAAAKGRERRKLRKRQRANRNRRIAFAVIPAFTALCILAEYLIR